MNGGRELARLPGAVDSKKQAHAGNESKRQAHANASYVLTPLLHDGSAC